jgi:hypothetical protein
MINDFFLVHVFWFSFFHVIKNFISTSCTEIYVCLYLFVWKSDAAMYTSELSIGVRINDFNISFENGLCKDFDYELA